MPVHRDAHRDLQAAIGAAVLSSAGTPAGLTARDPAQVARRFAVYRNNVVVGLVDALETRFPVVARLVGRAFFRSAARVFVAQSPPASPVLTVYGDAFPDFLAAFPPAATLAYLPDVARLEAARTHAYHAADAAPLTGADLAAYAARDPETWGLVPHPALRIVASAHPIVAILEAHAGEGAPAPLATRAAQTALVVRPAMRVLVHAAEPGEGAFLAASSAGASFAAAAETAGDADPAFDLPRALARSLTLGLAAAIRTLDPSGDPS